MTDQDAFMAFVELIVWGLFAMWAWSLGTRHGWTAWYWRVAQVVLAKPVLICALAVWLWSKARRVPWTGVRGYDEETQ